MAASGAEQLGLGRGEFRVGQGTLLVQGGELVQLIDHRRWLSCGRRRLRGLLLKVADALVLLRFGLLPLLRSPAHAPARNIGAPAYRGRAQQWTSPNKHVRLLHFAGQGEAEGNHDLRRGRNDLRPADLWCDRNQHTQYLGGRDSFIDRVAYLPQI
jgi:hypothetical protein